MRHASAPAAPTDEEAGAAAVGQQLLVPLAGIHHTLQLQRAEAAQQLVMRLRRSQQGWGQGRVIGAFAMPRGFSANEAQPDVCSEQPMQPSFSWYMPSGGCSGAPSLSSTNCTKFPHRLI